MADKLKSFYIVFKSYYMSFYEYFKYIGGFLIALVIFSFSMPYRVALLGSYIVGVTYILNTIKDRVAFRFWGIKPLESIKTLSLAILIRIGFIAPMLLSPHRLAITAIGVRESLHNPILYISAIIIAPLAEEFIYRWLPYNINVEKQKFVIYSANIFFAITHFNGKNIPEVVYMFVLGVLLSQLYDKTKSYWTIVLAHLMFNLINIILAFLFIKYT